jgi:hypothetical protein
MQGMFVGFVASWWALATRLRVFGSKIVTDPHALAWLYSDSTKRALFPGRRHAADDPRLR